jgi:hypothetical protein
LQGPFLGLAWAAVLDGGFDALRAFGVDEPVVGVGGIGFRGIVRLAHPEPRRLRRDVDPFLIFRVFWGSG